MCVRISTGFKEVSFRETHLREHFGRTDQIALITCLKKLNVSGAFLIEDFARKSLAWLEAVFVKGCFLAELKVTHLRRQRPICGFLRFSAKIFGFLRFSAVSCALQMLEFPGEGVNLRKSAVFCENLRFAHSLSP